MTPDTSRAAPGPQQVTLGWLPDRNVDHPLFTRVSAHHPPFAFKVPSLPDKGGYPTATRESGATPSMPEGLWDEPWRLTVRWPSCVAWRWRPSPTSAWWRDAHRIQGRSWRWATRAAEGIHDPLRWEMVEDDLRVLDVLIEKADFLTPRFSRREHRAGRSVVYAVMSADDARAIVGRGAEVVFW